MVRTLALIFIISFLAGCAGLGGSTSRISIRECPTGGTLVIPGKAGCPQ